MSGRRARFRLRSTFHVGVGMAVLSALGFSMKAIFAKLAYRYGVGPVAVLALRMAFSLPFFLAAAVWTARQGPPLSHRQRASVLALGLLGYYGASILDFYGLKYITAGLERLILFTYPTMAVLLGALVHRTAIPRRLVGATAVTYLGLALAFAHDMSVSEETAAVWTGSAFVFASALSFAVYLTGAGPMIAGLGSVRFTALAMLVSTAGVAVHFLLTEPVSALVVPLQVYGLCAAMAIFATVMPVFLLSASIARIGAGTSALVGTVGPVLTIAAGWWWLGEPISGAQIIGAALVILGVVLGGRRSS